MQHPYCEIPSIYIGIRKQGQQPSLSQCRTLSWAFSVCVGISSSFALLVPQCIIVSTVIALFFFTGLSILVKTCDTMCNEDEYLHFGVVNTQAHLVTRAGSGGTQGDWVQGVNFKREGEAFKFKLILFPWVNEEDFYHWSTQYSMKVMHISDINVVGCM